jgi:hypothetical protein
MNARRYDIIHILATGVVVMLLVSLVSFWARFLCHVKQYALVSRAAGQLTVRPTALFEAEDDPNITPCRVTVRMNDNPPRIGPFMVLGFAQYLTSRMPLGPGSHIYWWSFNEVDESVYFDPSLGLMVHKGIAEIQQPGGILELRHFVDYAGPEGIGEAPTKDLGRFTSPIAGVYEPQRWVIYDRRLRRFYAIHWRDRMVEQGPELRKDGRDRPVRIGVLEKNSMCLSVSFVPASMEEQPKETADTPAGAKRERPSVLTAIGSPYPMGNLLPVLDASGRIDLLDKGTLEFIGVAGHLSVAESLFTRSSTVGPDDVAAFSVSLISVPKGRGSAEWMHAGCAVATLSRGLTAMRLDVFDPNGRIVASEETPPYFELPGASTWVAAEFVIENLHPPLFMLASYLTASSSEATTGYRSLFRLPNSFVAMKARDRSVGWVGRFSTSLMLMLPAIGLAIFLAWRVARDAERIGLSHEAKVFAVLGTFALGLPAYVTYRLTRPKITLVTCRNCGLGRRPDREKCHHCGSLWHVPELIPPAWRVVEEGNWGVEEVQPGPAVPQAEDASEAP